MFLSTLIMAATNDELELERLNQIEAELTLQREWADYRWKKTNRSQEVLLNENQRIFKDQIKTQRDAQRAAERADPKRSQERADNEKAFQQKQKEAAARAADLEERRKDAPRRAQENKSGVKLD